MTDSVEKPEGVGHGAKSAQATAARAAAFSEGDRVRILSAHAPSSGDDIAGLDAITAFATALCDTPIALVTLVDDRNQTFVGRTGFATVEAPRDGSLCFHTMVQDGPTIIADTLADPRFRDTPAVTGEPHVRFYAGLPLVSDEGAALGALCVIDREPRGGLTPFQAQGLGVLRTAALDILRRRRSTTDDRVARAAAKLVRDEQEARFQMLADSMPQMVWSTRPDGYHDYYNARWYEFTGVPSGSTDGEAWNGVFHPDDQDRAWSAWRHCLATGEPYEIEYRLRDAEGLYRWVLGRALAMRDAGGAIVRWFGTCTDIHEQKLVLEQREIISHELSHRIKNIFAVVVGLVSLSSRAHPGFEPVADDLRERILALGRAHDHVRPHSLASRPAEQGSTLHGLLGELLAPYRIDGHDRFQVMGDDMVIDDRAATPLALAFHELATNASKYGALSTPAGRLRIDVAAGPSVVEIKWAETDGPEVASPARTGFGTRLIELSIDRQLGGRAERLWDADGLVVRMAIPIGAMSRPTAGRTT